MLAILSVLLGLALPSMHQMVRRHQVRIAAQDLLADLHWARAQAMRGGVPTRVRSLEAAECAGTPQGGRRNCGWRITGDGPGEPELRRHELPAAVDITSKYPMDVRFDQRDATAANTSSVSVRPTGAAADDPAARVICIAMSGRLRMAVGTEC